MQIKKYFEDFSVFILMFIFLIFAFSNIGFLFGASINLLYIFISFILSCFYLYISKNFFKKFFILSLIFFFSFVLANCYIDTSFDGRAYHFTIENILKLGYNPIWDNILNFAHKNQIYYNLLFANSYPNASETIRANFYLLFRNMESTKIVNFLLMFASFFYSYCFFSNKANKLKSFILSICTMLCAVAVCQINTKMNDIILYYIFIFQIFSLLLIKKNRIHSLIFILSCVLAIGTKYTGLFNCVLILIIYLIFYKKDSLKNILLIFILSTILCIQPYITNIIKFKNPLYPSMGFNKLDYMTKQNPKEFINKPYIYKFFRSMFSSTSDSRISNPQTPKLYYKIPFTNHYDLPYFSEDIRINGFGHIFSGIFIISLFLTLYQFRRRIGLLAISSIILTVILNPICWWARFVPQLHLLPVFNCFYFRKNKIIFSILAILIIVNGLWVLKENFAVNAYKTYVINNFYNNLYEISQTKKISVYIDKTPFDEDDSTILQRLKEYGVDYNIADKTDIGFNTIKTDATITKSYMIKID